MVWFCLCPPLLGWHQDRRSAAAPGPAPLESPAGSCSLLGHRAVSALPRRVYPDAQTNETRLEGKEKKKKRRDETEKKRKGEILASKNLSRWEESVQKRGMTNVSGRDEKRVRSRERQKSEGRRERETWKEERERIRWADGTTGRQLQQQSSKTSPNP